MLQFITADRGRHSIVEQVKGAVAGGCRWIELSAPSLDKEALKKVATEIIPTCKEADAFVIVREHPELAAELRLHGILMAGTTRAQVAATREEMGGEAVIGIKISTADEAAALGRLDIDYLVVTVADADKPEAEIALLKDIRERGVKTPVVAEGEFDAYRARKLVDEGFSGVAVSATIADTRDIAFATRELLDALK